MGHKAVEQLATSTAHLVQELLMNIQCSGGSWSFAEEMRALKMRSTVAGHWKLTMTNWELSSKLILLQLHEKLPKNSTLTILQSFVIWSKVGASWADGKSEKLFWSVVFSHSIQQQTNHFSIGLWRATKSGFYTTTSDDPSVIEPRRNSRALRKAKLAPIKGHGHCLVVCCPYDPLQLSESR